MAYKALHYPAGPARGSLLLCPLYPSPDSPKCPEGIQPRNTKNRDIYWRTYNIQETLYTGYLRLSPLQRRDLTQFSQSPSAAPSYFPESHWRSEISPLSKVILVLGKSRSCRAPNLGCRWDWVTWAIWCFAKKLCKDVMHQWARCADECAHRQLPIAAAVFLVLQPTKNIEVVSAPH